VDVVVLAVELAQLGAQVGADLPHDLFAVGEHRVVEDVPPIPGDEDKMYTQIVDNASTSANIRIRDPSR
jgi:hypothetical protein